MSVLRLFYCHDETIIFLAFSSDTRWGYEANQIRKRHFLYNGKILWFTHRLWPQSLTKALCRCRLYTNFLLLKKWNKRSSILDGETCAEISISTLIDGHIFKFQFKKIVNSDNHYNDVCYELKMFIHYDDVDKI